MGRIRVRLRAAEGTPGVGVLRPGMANQDLQLRAGRRTNREPNLGDGGAPPRPQEPVRREPERSEPTPQPIPRGDKAGRALPPGHQAAPAVRWRSRISASAAIALPSVSRCSARTLSIPLPCSRSRLGAGRWEAHPGSCADRNERRPPQDERSTRCRRSSGSRTLYAVLIWLAGNLIIDGPFGSDQAVWVSALLLLSMIATRALGRRIARARSPERRCLVLGDAKTTSWIKRRFDEAPGSEKARVVGRWPPRRIHRGERQRFERLPTVERSRRDPRSQSSALSGSNARSSPRAGRSRTSCSKRPDS